MTRTLCLALFLLSGCADLRHDPLAVYRFEPQGMPVTVFSLGF